MVKKYEWNSLLRCSCVQQKGVREVEEVRIHVRLPLSNHV